MSRHLSSSTLLMSKRLPNFSPFEVMIIFLPSGQEGLSFRDQLFREYHWMSISAKYAGTIIFLYLICIFRSLLIVWGLIKG